MNGALFMNAFSDSDIINYVVRMVVPMRREFGRRLDVQLFMRDSGYARQVLDEALTSQDTRLLDYARYVSRRVLSPRIAVQGESAPRATEEVPTHPMAFDVLGSAHAKAGPASPPLQPKPTAAPAAEPGPSADEKALRQAMLKKYTSGLR
jgi:hypothetical protein